MESYAKRLALEHNIQGKTFRQYYPIYQMKLDFEKIQKAYEVLTESVSLDIPIPPSGEWILDNFYVIEEQVNSIQEELKIEEYKKLPSVKGKARIYLLAEKLVTFTDGNVTKEIIERFISSYESKRKISMDEMWIFPVMIKIALIQYIKIIAERIITSQHQKFKVASLVERIIKNKDVNDQLFYEYRSINLNGQISSYVEFLAYLLKKEGKSAKKYIDILNEEIRKAGTSLDEIIKTEHYDMALRRVSASNSITSMKNILRYNWSTIFEKINGIENILLEDKWYSKSDYDTKTLYRNEIQKIAKKAKISEIYVVSLAMEIAKKENIHVGQVLLGENREIFLKGLGLNTKNKMTQKQKLFLYLGFIYLPATIVSLITMKNLFWMGIIPLSEIFVKLVNKFVSKTKKPQILPRLEEISDDVKTFVIIPTLINNQNKAKEIIDNLEIFYLSNKSENLYFALLGDASEEDTEYMNFDQEIINTGKREVEKLNQKYGKEKFFFLYRQRKYNSSQKKWLGYERKRGMITEFVNFLVTKEKGSFLVNTITDIPEIKYIITLDSDTILPMDTAKKLIGTMEHPLNQPVVQGKIVTKGYGLIQPKVGITMEASTSSLFSKLFAGDGGIDAYSTAESNVYQDLFGEGIFTGKGIFNVKLFHALLKDEIPENTVLSHDLLEGSYLRCRTCK